MKNVFLILLLICGFLVSLYFWNNSAGINRNAYFLIYGLVVFAPIVRELFPVLKKYSLKSYLFDNKK